MYYWYILQTKLIKADKDNINMDSNSKITYY